MPVVALTKSEIVEAFLSMPNSIGDSPLHMACGLGRAEIASWLYDKGGTLVKRNNEGLDWLTMLIVYRKGLLRPPGCKCCEGNIRPEEGQSSYAAAHGPESAKESVGWTFNLNGVRGRVRSVRKYTAIDTNSLQIDMHAYMSTIEQLEDTSVIEEFDLEFIHEVMNFVWLDPPANRKVTDPALETMKQLLKRGVDTNNECASGMTPLHYAARFGDVEYARALLDAGADPFKMGGSMNLLNPSSGSYAARKQVQTSPLHVAKHLGHKPMEELISTYMEKRRAEAELAADKLMLELLAEDEKHAPIASSKKKKKSKNKNKDADEPSVGTSEPVVGQEVKKEVEVVNSPQIATSATPAVIVAVVKDTVGSSNASSQTMLPMVNQEPAPAVKREQATAVKQESAPAVKREQAPAVKQEPAPAVKREQATAVKQESVSAVKREQATAVKQESVSAVKREQATAVKQELATAIKREQAPAVKREQAPALKQELATAVKREQATAVKREQAPAVKQEQAPAVKREQATSVKQAPTSSIVQEVPRMEPKQPVQYDSQSRSFFSWAAVANSQPTETTIATAFRQLKPPSVVLTVPEWHKDVYADQNAEDFAPEWLSVCRDRLHEVHPLAAALGLGCEHILGHDIDALSAAQLEAAEEVHRELLSRLADARVRLAVEQERQRLKEAKDIDALRQGFRKVKQVESTFR